MNDTVLLAMVAATILLWPLVFARNKNDLRNWLREWVLSVVVLGAAILAAIAGISYALLFIVKAFGPTASVLFIWTAFGLGCAVGFIRGRAMRFGQRVVLVVMLVGLAIGLAEVPARTYAQSGWLVIPGQSWGPVSLGETEDGVISTLGPPRSRSDSALASTWKYPRAILEFVSRVSENPSDIPKLWKISVWEPATEPSSTSGEPREELRASMPGP